MTASLSSSHRSRDRRGADHGAVERSRLQPLPALDPRPPLHLVAPEGQLQVHTAPYRGSFGTVLSQALRSAGLGSRVAVMQFLKGGVAQGPEAALTLCDRMTWMRPAVMECLSQPASSSEPATIEAVEAVWAVSAPISPAAISISWCLMSWVWQSPLDTSMKRMCVPAWKLVRDQWM